MSLTTACPESADLQRFMRGQASTVEAACVMAHLGRCDRCRAIAAGVSADGNTFVDESGGTSECEHTFEIDPPVPESSAKIRPAESESHGRAEPRNGPPPLDSTTFAESRQSHELAVSRNGQACIAGVQCEDLGTIGDEADIAPPSPDLGTLGDEADIAPPLPDLGTLGDEADAAPPQGTATFGDEADAAPPQGTATFGDEADAAPPQGTATFGDEADAAPPLPPAKGDATILQPGTTPKKDRARTQLRAAQNFGGTVNFDGGAATGPLDMRGLSAGAGSIKGVVVPGYDILEELGRGGMGVVYKARHHGLNRLVALKMVLAGAHLGKMGLARFKAEAEAIARVQHANIVQIYETGEHNGHPYFSLEFVEGGSLEKRMRESPTPPKAAAQLVETLARAIEFAHQCGIVHRDLKPANILLAPLSSLSSIVRKEQPANTSLAGDHWSRTTIPKVADFGLAKRVDDESAQTHTGAVLGTPCYMAPEQAGGKTKEIGPAADIYALGVILYELLTGRPPFKAGNPIDTIRQVIEQEPVPPRQLEPRTPHDLETICLKCLEKDPSRRYATAAALADELRRFLDGEPITARPTPAWERAWKWGQRRPAIVALMGVCTLAVLAMVSFIVWHNVSLRGQLADALEVERQTKKRLQDELDEKELSRLRNQGQKLYDSAQASVAASDWPSARVHLVKALATLGSDPRLADVRDPAQALLTQVEDRRASQARFDKFVELRDKARFLGTMYTGMDLASNLNEARATVHKALDTYDVAVEGKNKPTLDAFLKDAQKAAILADCYQLLLILAETEAMSAHDLKPPEKEQRLREALRLLERAPDFGAPSRAYHVRRARYLTQLGDKAGAAQAEKAARGAAVVDALDHFLMADEFYRQENYESATREFGDVLQRQPNHFWAQYLNALCLIRLQRFAEANVQLTAGISQRPNFVWLYLLRGFARTEMKVWNAAEADFDQALNLPLDEYSRYVLYVNRGVMRLHQAREADAIADLQAAIKLKPKEAMAFVNMALVYRHQKKLDLAVKQMDHALEVDKENARYYRLRARLYVESKEPALALKDFEQAISREGPAGPDYAEDHVEQGRVLLGEKKLAEALASFEVALRSRKDHPLGQRLRAEALFHLGRHQEVVEAFDRYLDMGCKPLESVYRGRGLARAELGQYPGAIDDFTKALDLPQTSAARTSELLAYRGWMHWVVDAKQLALRDFELAIEVDAKNGNAYNGRGLIRASMGKHADARKDAEEAVRQGPASPRLLFNAARIYCQSPGGERRALDLIAQALALLPAEQRPAFWSAYVQTDRGLDGLRRLPRYLQLERDVSPRKS